MKSENIDLLAAALSAAQGEFKPVAKTGKNPHLGNEYVTLDGIIESVRKPLSTHGLAYTQLLNEAEAGLMLETFLFHTSGQWLSACVRVVAMTGNRGVNEMQALGGALTYLKRYALAALLGISADEDDDGETRTRVVRPPQKSVPQDAPTPTPETPTETEAEALARQGAAVAQAKEAYVSPDGLRNKAEERPYTPVRLRIQLQKSFVGRAAFAYTVDGERDKSQFTVNKNLELAFAGEGQETEKRHVVLFFLTKKQSSKELLDGELESLRRWLAVSQNADGEWSPDPVAVAEAKAAYIEGLKEAGQTSF